MKDKYDIQELVDKVNELMPIEEDVTNGDGRLKQLSVRRLRDLQAKGMISEPEKDGRNAYYNESHLEEVMGVRKLQMQGLSESVIQKMVTEGSANLLYSTALTATSYISSVSPSMGQNNTSSSVNTLTMGDGEFQSVFANSGVQNDALAKALAEVAPVPSPVQAESLRKAVQRIGSQESIRGLSMAADKELQAVSNEKETAKQNYLRTLQEEESKSVPLGEDIGPFPVTKVETVYNLVEGVALHITKGQKLNEKEKEKLIKNINKVINQL